MNHIAEEYKRICKGKSKTLDPETLGVWKSILAPATSPSLLRLAADECLSREQWFPDPGSVLAAYRRIEAESATGANMSAEPDHWRRQTVRCKRCGDTGYVSIWSRNAMRAALAVIKGTEQPEVILQAQGQGSCCCCADCEVGETRAKGWARRHRRDDWERYQFRSPPMIAVDVMSTWQEQIDQLLSWAREWKPENYVAEFDNF